MLKWLQKIADLLSLNKRPEPLPDKEALSIAKQIDERLAAQKAAREALKKTHLRAPTTADILYVLETTMSPETFSPEQIQVMVYQFTGLQISKQALGSNLSRLLKQGKIVRPVRGQYKAAPLDKVTI